MQKLFFLWNSHEIFSWFGPNYMNNFSVHLPFCFQSQPAASNVEQSEKYLRKTEEIKQKNISSTVQTQQNLILFLNF